MKNWREDLNDIFDQRNRKEIIQHDYEEKIKHTKYDVEQFYNSVVLLAFDELKQELRRYNRTAKINYQEDAAHVSIVVAFEEFEEYKYDMLVNISTDSATVDTEHICLKNNRHRGGWLHCGKDYGGTRISTVSREEIIRDFLRGYRYCLLYQ